jgi:hypothetical protein
MSGVRSNFKFDIWDTAGATVFEFIDIVSARGLSELRIALLDYLMKALVMARALMLLVNCLTSSLKGSNLLTLSLK